MTRTFEYLTNLAVRCPLTRGEGIRLLKIRGCRIGNRMEGKPENVRTQQPNSLSTRERARERATNRRLASLAKDTALSTQ